MTENESLKIMLAYKLGRGCKPYYSDEEIEKAFDTAISALQEIRRYREIGTVEECRDAMEKQKPKVPEFTHMLGEYTGKFKCPICEQSFSYDCTDAKVFFCKKMRTGSANGE